MPQPMVSVVIPAYNSERYVADAVKSVLAQSYPPAEVIVVDDGSTDGTARVVQAFGNSVRYLHQTNRGEPAARNLGLRNSQSEYVAFLDADDLWRSDKLKLQMEYFAAHPNCAVVYSDMSTFDDRGVVDPSVKVRFNITFPSGKIFVPLFRETLFGSGSVIFRKNCVDQVGYFDEQFLIGCDYEMWLRMSRHFEFGVVDEPLLMYRQHSQMSTRGLGRALWNGVPWEVAALTKTLRSYPEAVQELGRSTVNRRIAKVYADLAHTQFQLQEYKDARQLFDGALRYRRTNPQYWAFYLATFLSPGQIAGMRKLYKKMSGGNATDSQARSKAHAAS